MPSHLHISVTFLQPTCHARRGKEDAAPNEWPPSPLRLFQAMVAGAAARWAGRGRGEAGGDDSTCAELSAPAPVAALHWLENLCESSPPVILAPCAVVGSPVPHYVPNNSADLVAAKWAKGDTFATFDDRTRKLFRPTHMQGGTTIHYLWSLDEAHALDGAEHIETLTRSARCIVALGWGIDAAIGDARIVDGEAVDASVDGARQHLVRWTPRPAFGSGTTLRLPCQGTFDALVHRHGAFLKRLEGGVFRPVPPLRVFRQIAYTRYTRGLAPAPRPFAAFTLRPVGDSSDKKVSFPQHRSVCVAAMLRHAALEAAKSDLDSRPDGWRTPDWAEQFVAGHGPRKPNGRYADESWPRFSYLPLPSLTPIGVGDIRRVLIAEPVGGAGQAATWATRRLAGADLIDQRTQNRVAILEPLSNADFVLSQYTAKSAARREWSSVSPVILPGYDDGKPAKRERLLVECLRHAGYDAAAIESIESRPTSWFPRVASSLQFKRPAYLRNLPAVHVRLRFHEPIPGPISMGAGRHCGLGVFAAIDT